MHNSCPNPDCAPPECPWRNTCPTPNAKCELNGTEGSSLQLLSGWHQEDAGKSLWSTHTALLVLRNPALRSLISVSGVLPASSHHVRNTLQIYCNGSRVGEVVNYSGKSLNFALKKLIPPSSSELLHLKFCVSDPYCPFENETSSDRRRLGFALFQVLAARPRGLIKSFLADLAMDARVLCTDWLARTIARWIQGGRSSPYEYPDDRESEAASGLSIVVIDDEKPDALERCISSVGSAVQKIDVPVELVVVSNTRPEALSFLPSKISPHWIDGKDSHTYSHALRMGAEQARHNWLYVVSGRYRLDDSTLSELLKWRAPRVFAVGSTVSGGSSWMGVKRKDALTAPEYRKLDAGTYARGALGVSPECSLFNRPLLLQLWGERDAYGSQDWANLEWGVRSWRLGFETILCPGSQVRGGLGTPPERPDFAKADALRFLLRNTFPHAGDLRGVISRILNAGLRTSANLLNPVALLSYRSSRSLEHAFRFGESLLDSVNGTYYINPDRKKPALIFASPYVLFPPSHGSAVGMSHLLLALRQWFSVHILSDEMEAYTDESLSYFEPFATVRLLSGRREDSEKLHDRIARIESHCRPEMEQTLRMLLSVYQPHFVEIEHIELAKLIDSRQSSTAQWILNLHDVFLSDEIPGGSAEDRYELDLVNRFDRLICYSSEDASLLGRPDVTVIPNGVDLADIKYEPSPPIPRILFIGPWRSPQNVPGILSFLEHVYPFLLPRLANLELWYLGGKGVHELADRDSRFRQRGVEIFEYVDDVQEVLRKCALTINPISGNRGSCRKVVESLAAGRACVSTREGARGYLDLGIPSLVICETIQDFPAPMLRLLEDVDYRRNLECLDDCQRYKLSWEHSQERLLSLYASLGAKTGYSSTFASGRA